MIPNSQLDGSIGKQYLKDYSNNTDHLFEEHLQKKIEEAQVISKIPAELLKRFLATARRGKRIRGALMQLGYELCGGEDVQAILDASISIELFHAGVLVHDDVMDEDDLRRGLETLHLQFRDIGSAMKVSGSPLHYGESMAVNVGDAAFYLSWQKLLESRFSAERILEAGKIYADYVVRVVHGQVLDITTMSMHSLTEEDVLKVLRLKSAEYTGVLPLLMGAALSGETNKERLKTLHDYGLAFGWAFQIQDDTLGLYGKEEEFGKPVGSDLREGKNTLFMLHLARHGSEEDRSFQRRILGNHNITKEEVHKMCELLKEVGSYKYVIDLGWKYVEEGRAIVPKITEDKKLQTILESVIIYMMERTM